ncbi:AAA family ATPase [Flavobacterium sp. SM15]|uniref:ATP-dependent nuclease n=1 Tax=Flavobacterium sp. SM15 TaxID=2908005 RepID=UPI001EDBDA46|nr:AAA family ATPase [Flavobacterium sp. SM15]MCG2611651.1 AAA family ATPase [Flavobacterium sp. SM15]
MYISKISIKNFKCIQELTIYPNEKFNVIIGENNQGKTTIFEALQIWYRCYQLYIRPNRTDFYQGNNLYLAYKDLNFLRLSKDTDLFRSAPNEAIIGLMIKDQDTSGNDVSFDLQFKINRPQSISNAYLRVLKNNNQQFIRFAAHLKTKHVKLDDAIFLYQTNPIAQVLSQEPFMNEGQVRKKITRGKSQEVLRNKILLHNNLINLETQVSNVLGGEVKFKITNKDRKDRDEYINLQVQNRGHSLDLHLQGSGLIQVTEIFATVDYLESKLNILLIDEPDSHIHLALQKRLMTNLQSMSDNQSFIITHNDGFVSQISDGELFYLNQDAKTSKVLNPLTNADLIKKDFGSPILTLEKLNSSENIIFVEGTDDKYYIEKLLEKFIEHNIITNSQNLKPCFYFQVRGKDNLSTKIEHNKRTLSQLFNDKKYIVVTDKDFTSLTNSTQLNISIKQKLGPTSDAFCHDGYCIESTLFSDLTKLYEYLAYVTSQNVATIESQSNIILDLILTEVQNVTSARYQKFQQQFNSQKNNRQELASTMISDVILDATQNRATLKYIMNKHTIREYITQLENACSVSVVPGGVSLSDEDFCNKLFLNYIDQITTHNVLYDNHKLILEKIYSAEY